MKVFKKIIFPFFNKERHGFLFKKWWIRALMVTYVIFLALSFRAMIIYEVRPVESCIAYYNEDLSWMNDDEKDVFTEECLAQRLKMLPGDIASSLLSLIIIHYIAQLIFFKIIVDYVAMGNKK
ncbi:MAG: hypothetical protein ACOXZ1_03705 [Patescibacteria group bacterium]|jgi:hypothetical protein